MLSTGTEDALNVKYIHFSKRLLYETIYIKLGEHVKKNWNEFLYGWLDSGQIFCGFDSRKTRLDSTQTFYGSAFAASAAAPRST